MNHKDFTEEELLSALEAEIGPVTAIREWNPGVYHIATDEEGLFLQEYFVVLDNACIASKVQNYGKKMDGLRLFAQADDSSGWRIVEYENSKYNITVKKKPVPEPIFRDTSLHAMECHPEYFGTFPVPFHTPHGCTLRHRTLANGIYWLETSECREMLTVCFPIWNAELSVAASVLSEITEWDRRNGASRSACYIFFSKKASCIPLYELMETRREWDGTVISRPALMNAIWAFMPKYALHLNGQRDEALAAEASKLLHQPGVQVFPGPNRKQAACMYPGAGTDFLLLR